MRIRDAITIDSIAITKDSTRIIYCGVVSRDRSTYKHREGGMLTKRRDVRRYYRHLRAICTQHYTAVIPFMSQAAILEQAKRLRLATDGLIVTNSTEELTLVYDLAT